MGKNNHNPTTTILLAILVVMQVVVSFYFWQGNLKLQRENLVLKELNRQQQHQTEVLAHQLTVQHEAVGKKEVNDLPYFAEISADGRFKMFFCLENNNIGVFLDFIKSNYAIH